MKVRQLNECSALLVGATTSIGFESAAQLAEAGVPRIMIVGRSEQRGQKAVDAIKTRAPGCDVRFFSGDPTKYAGAEKIVQAMIDAFGAIDILVNAIPGPGNGTPAPFHQKDPAELDDLITYHFSANVYMCRAALPFMIEREGGSIINFTSDAAKIATPGEAVIGGGKAGTTMFSRTIALEQARNGIRVNIITPSIVGETSGWDRVMANEFSKKLFEKAVKKAKLGLVTPVDIAPLVVFLAGPGSAKITGQAISVNGAISAA
ncbi:MAG: SDR family NAD(P)-dependent oxidoreductase [Flavobacteriaceae bacterium]